MRRISQINEQEDIRFSDHRYVIRLYTYDEEEGVPEEEASDYPAVLEISFVPNHIPGSLVRTNIQIPLDSGFEISRLIKVLTSAEADRQRLLLEALSVPCA